MLNQSTPFEGIELDGFERLPGSEPSDHLGLEQANDALGQHVIVGIGCTRSDRAGRYRLAALIERFSPSAGGPDVPATLSADCSRRGINRYGDPYCVY